MGFGVVGGCVGGKKEVAFALENINNKIHIFLGYMYNDLFKNVTYITIFKKKILI